MKSSNLIIIAIGLGIFVGVSIAYGLKQQLPNESNTQLTIRINALEERVDQLEQQLNALTCNDKTSLSKSPSKSIPQPKGLPQGYDRDRQRFLDKNPTPSEIDRYNRLHGPRVWKDGAWCDGDEIHYPSKNDSD